MSLPLGARRLTRDWLGVYPPAARRGAPAPQARPGGDRPPGRGMWKGTVGPTTLSHLQDVPPVARIAAPPVPAKVPTSGVPCPTPSQRRWRTAWPATATASGCSCPAYPRPGAPARRRRDRCRATMDLFGCAELRCAPGRCGRASSCDGWTPCRARGRAALTSGDAPPGWRQSGTIRILLPAGVPSAVSGRGAARGVARLTSPVPAGRPVRLMAPRSPPG